MIIRYYVSVHEQSHTGKLLSSKIAAKSQAIIPRGDDGW
jgi:hypothetical protein